MNDEQMQTLLDGWYRDRDEAPRDAHGGIARVVVRVPQTRQRGRWWPLPVFDRPAPTPDTDGRQPARGFTMFSAVKFVVASVIVALFGGFLLAGVLTTPQDDEVAPAAVTESPSPMTTEELLSGMVTEEVEPGVLRVVNDGVRDLTYSAGAPFWADAVMVDGTGGVWRSQPGGRVYRLGTEQETSASGLVDFSQGTIEATPDGRLVTVAAGGLRVLDGESWSPDEYGMGGDYGAIAVQDDGSVWLLGDGGLVRTNTGRVPEYFELPDTYDGEADGRHLAVTADGEAWLMSRSEEGRWPIDVFLHFDGSDWEVVPGPDDAAPAGPGFDVGPAGTLWTVADSVFPHRSLARYDGSDWTVFDEADGVQPWGAQPVGAYGAPADMVRVAPDGSAWVNAVVPGDYLQWVPADWMEEEGFEQLEWTDDWDWDTGVCDGLARYDGESWASYLSGMCVTDYDFAPDGAVWVVAKGLRGDERNWETYVITPEAGAATPVADEG